MKPWTDQHDQALIDGICAGRTLRETGAAIGRSKNACAGRAWRLQISNPKRPAMARKPRCTTPMPQAWPQSDVETLTDMIANGHSFGEVATKLTRTKGSVNTRWRKIVREMGAQAV